MAPRDKPAKTAEKTRVRRSPEAARELILSAATEVFAELGPDRAGLKEVALKAGVSHGLVTHYFGTFDALVEQVLALRLGETRETLLTQIASAGAELPFAELVRIGVRAARDPILGRLMAWAFLSGRIAQTSFFPHQQKGLRRIVDALTAHPEFAQTAITREELERRIVLVWCALLSYSVAAPTLWSALDQPHTPERDAAIEADLVAIATANL